MASLVDPKEISELLLLLYAAGNDRARWCRFIDALALVTESDGAALVVQDLRTGKADGIWSAYDPAESESFLNYYSRINPWLPARETPAVAAGGQVDNSDDVLPLPVLRRTEFYNDWGRKNQVVHSVAANLGVHSGYMRYVCVNRGENGGIGASEKALAVLELLVDHMRNAFRLQEALSGLGDVQGLLDRLQFPILILDRDCRIVDRSETGRQVFASASELPSLAGEIAALERETFTPFRLVQLNPPLNDVRALLTRTSTVLDLGPRKYMLVLLDPAAAGDSRALTALFRLTPAEARFVQTLVRTGSLDLTLEDLHLSRNTGRSHMRAIFHKTGANRQGQVIQLFSLLGRIRS